MIVLENHNAVDPWQWPVRIPCEPPKYQHASIGDAISDDTSESEIAQRLECWTRSHPKSNLQTNLVSLGSYFT